MLQSVELIEWVKLFVGIVVFLGPGFCIISILYKDTVRNFTHWFILSLSASACTWGILLAWLKLINLKMNSSMVWIFFISGWLIGIIYLLANRGFSIPKKFPIKWNEGILWVISIATGLIVVWSLRHQVAGLGSDSYHHTLITQLIHDLGGIPSNYQPATDQLISFSYHYGYHASMAALMWLSGWDERLIVLVSGAFLVMISVISMALLTQEITENPISGIVAGVFTGIIFVFPTFMLNWGRYTQLSGLFLLTVFIQVLIAYFKEYNQSINFRKIILLAILAAGTAITHYRVTIMAFAAVIFLVIFFKKNTEYSFRKNLKILLPLLIIAGIAFLLFSPWLWQVVKAHQSGFTIPISDINASFFSLSRLGAGVLEYPTNYLVMLFTICGLLWGLIKREWFIFWVSAWTAAMLLISGQGIMAISMDRISVIISLYIPAAIVIGWFFQEAYSHVKSTYRVILVIPFIVMLIWSGSVALNKNLTGTGFVTPADLKAAAWIKENTPDEALFAENTYKFDFSTNFIIGIDAGYWLPILADRHTITIPMIFNLENFAKPDGLQQLIDLYNLGGDLSTPQALDYFRNEKVSYIYVGEQGGWIQVSKLIQSNSFSLVYQDDNVYIFKIID